MKEVFQDQAQLDQLCVERCQNLFAPYEITAEHGVDLQAAYRLLGKVEKHVGLKVLKTWLNAWATSHRMHEDCALDCLLGCSHAKDCLSHYIHCPHLFAMQRYLFQDISDDPAVRFGIKSPDILSFKVISCLFSAYHALKRDVRAGRINVHSETWLQSAWSLFAEVCKAEAGELRVHTRAFSLAKSIDFLATGSPSLPAPNYLMRQANQ